MTIKKVFRIVVMSVFVVSLANATLWADPTCQKGHEAKKEMGQGCMKTMGHACMALAHVPGLTPEQNKKMEALHGEHQALMAPLQAEMAKQTEALKAMMKDPIDVAKVEAQIDVVAKMRADMQKKCLAHRLAIRALLTNEQKAKFGPMGLCMMGGMGCKMGQKAHGQCGSMHDKKTEPGKCPMAAGEKK